MLRDLREHVLLLAGGLATGAPMRRSFLAARRWYAAAAGELERERNARLQALIEDAYAHTPYWTRLFDERGLKPGDIRTKEDLSLLPVMNKETVRSHEEAMTRRPAIRGTAEIGSSGSTGEYATFLETPVDAMWERVNNLLACHELGFRLGDSAMLFGVSLPRPRLKRIKDALTSTRYVFAFDGSDDVMKEVAQMVHAGKVRMIGGYASSLYLLAHYIERLEPQSAYPHVLGAVSWGETLYPAWREAIERVFDAPAINTYGAAGETGVWGFQCAERDKFHICDWSCIVEVVKDGKPAAPGELGEILITGLYKYARPLIRYRIGDLAVASDGPCRCGRETGTVQEIVGRVTDIVTTPSGIHISFAVFPGYFEHAPGIAQFQIVQNTIDTLDINLVKSDRFSEPELDAILEKIREGSNHELQLNVRFMDDIPPTSSGKRRFVISRVGFSGVADSRELLANSGKDAPAGDRP